MFNAVKPAPLSTGIVRLSSILKAEASSERQPTSPARAERAIRLTSLVEVL